MHLVDIGGMGRRVSDERDFSMVKFSYTYTYIYIKINNLTHTRCLFYCLEKMKSCEVLTGGETA
jgi:hypothetical protein